MEGNQMKMRETLEFVHDKLLTWNYTDKATAKIAVAIVDRCSKALSAPARQCDVGTPEDQGERCMAQFDQWRRKGDGHKLITAIMAWAQTPYAAQEGCEE